MSMVAAKPLLQGMAASGLAAIMVHGQMGSTSLRDLFDLSDRYAFYVEGPEIFSVMK